MQALLVKDKAHPPKMKAKGSVNSEEFNKKYQTLGF